MRSALRWVLVVIAAVFSLAGLSSADAQQNLALWVPPSTNTVAIVRVADLLNSPLGRQRKWVDEYRDAYANGIVAAPPSVLEAIRATEYRPYAKGAQPVYSIYSMRVDVSMSEIAKHELTQAEKIGDGFAVNSQRGVYFARLGSKMLGALQPADRQLLSRWLRFGQTNTKPQLTPYLAEALEAEKKPQVVIIVDLTDMIDPAYIARWLSASPSLQAQKIDSTKLTEQLATLRGLRLSLTVAADIRAQLALDFAEPVTASKESLQAMVLEWLDNSGARIDTLANAEASIRENSFVLETQVEEQGLRRILSLIQTQHPAEAATEPATTQLPEANSIASLRYYKGIVAAVNDLGFQTRKAKDYEKTALWHENYAAKIEGMSTRGVDPELAAWGYDVAQKLRALAGSLKGLPVQVDQLNRQIRVDVQTFNRRVATTEWGAFFRPEGFTTTTNLQDVRAAQQDLIAKDQEDRANIWAMLEQDRQAVVSKMKEKYGVDFDKK